MTDAQLALLSQRGDRHAFGSLARRWHHPLFRFLRKHLGDAEEARDACQETLLKAYINIGTLKTPEHFKTWIHQIALNLCRDRSRSARHRTTRPFSSVDPEDGNAIESTLGRPGPLDERARAGLAATLEKALARLPEQQRSAILLREIQGFTCDEIARIEGVCPGTVRSRIYCGLKTLRRLMPLYGVVDAPIAKGGTVP